MRIQNPDRDLGQIRILNPIQKIRQSQNLNQTANRIK
jgi:hypothetical protein